MTGAGRRPNQIDFLALDRRESKRQAGAEPARKATLPRPPRMGLTPVHLGVFEHRPWGQHAPPRGILCQGPQLESQFYPY